MYNSSLTKDFDYIVGHLYINPTYMELRVVVDIWLVDGMMVTRRNLTNYSFRPMLSVYNEIFVLKLSVHLYLSTNKMRL